MNKKLIGYGSLILVLGLFVIKPLLTDSIRKFRYENEIKPIRKGMIQHIKREQKSFPGNKGIIYTLSTIPNSKVEYITGFSKDRNTIHPYFDLSVKLPSGYRTFSRDTTVGQVVGILLDHHDSIAERDKNRIYNIYFQPGTDIIDTKINRSVSIMRVYLRDSLYDAVFIANTFDKDISSKPNILAKKRLKRIEEVLGGIRTQYQQTINN